MEEYLKDFTICHVGASPIKNLGFLPNQCLRNAYITAEGTGAMIVEGLLRIGNAKFVRHAWNKKDGLYFDTTKDYVYETNEFKEQMAEHGVNRLSYDYIKCVEYDIDECNRDEDGNILFHYSYDTILEIANKNPSVGTIDAKSNDKRCLVPSKGSDSSHKKVGKPHLKLKLRQWTLNLRRWMIKQRQWMIKRRR